MIGLPCEEWCETREDTRSWTNPATAIYKCVRCIGVLNRGNGCMLVAPDLSEMVV